MKTLNQIKDQMKRDDVLSFDNIMERAKAQYPCGAISSIAHAAKRLAAEKAGHICWSGYSSNDQYRMWKKWFSLKVFDESVRLPINRRGQPNLQASKALQRLLKQGYIKVVRDGTGFSKQNIFGWKTYSVHQSYLVIN